MMLFRKATMKDNGYPTRWKGKGILNFRTTFMKVTLLLI